MSLVVRKPAFCICENKDADQLRGTCNSEADQRICLRYLASTIPLLRERSFDFYGGRGQEDYIGPGFFF